MRGVLTFLLIFLFFFVFPLSVFSYTINKLLTPTYIKARLDSSGVYQLAADTLPKMFEEEQEKDVPIGPQEAMVRELLKEQINASYVQTKTEILVDDTFVWLEGRSATPPVVDLNDMKAKVLQAAPPGTKSTDIDKFFNGNLTIEPFKDSPEVQTGFQVLRRSSVALFVISLVILVLLLVIAFGWKSKFRKVALALFGPSVLGILLTLVVFFMIMAGAGILRDNLPQGLDSVQGPLDSSTNAIAMDFAKENIIVFGVAIGVAFLLFLISLFIHNQPKNINLEQQ